MTNEEFLDYVACVTCHVDNAKELEYARKLVALSEAAKAVAENTVPKTCCKCGTGEDYVLDGITLHVLSNILAQLENSDGGGEE